MGYTLNNAPAGSIEPLILSSVSPIVRRIIKCNQRYLIESLYIKYIFGVTAKLYVKIAKRARNRDTRSYLHVCRRLSVHVTIGTRVCMCCLL